MKITPNETSPAALIIFLGLLVFLQLTAGEIQPWDEGLYAFRAKAIVHGADFFDQTNGSIGGLYSSTYPPLSVWIMALFMKIFGENTLSVRLFSALCSVASLVLIHRICERFTSKRNALAAPILLLGTLVWNTYSRQGMTDVPLVFFALLALESVLTMVESRETSQKVRWACVFAIALAASLMTKIVVSFMPLLFIAMLFFDKDKIFERNILIIAAVIGIGLATPWYAMMIARHGAEFYGALFVPHIYAAVENNTRSLGLLYYFNQLLISNPIFLFSLLFSSLMVSHKFRRKIFDKYADNYILRAMLVWFAGGFVIFSLSVTKLEHYSVYLVIPGILLAVKFYEKMDLLIRSPRQKTTVFIALSFTAIWSLSWDLRQYVKSTFSGSKIGIFVIVALVLFSGLIILIKHFDDESINILSNQLKSRIWIAVLVLCGLRIGAENILSVPGRSFGAMQTSILLEQSGLKDVVYLYHSKSAADSLNPQLAWYTRGWIAGFRKDRSYQPIGMKWDKYDLPNLSKIDDYPNLPLIYYFSNNNALTAQIVDDIQETRDLIAHFDNYVVFSRKIHGSKEKVLI